MVATPDSAPGKPSRPVQEVVGGRRSLWMDRRDIKLSSRLSHRLVLHSRHSAWVCRVLRDFGLVYRGRIHELRGLPQLGVEFKPGVAE